MLSLRATIRGASIVLVLGLAACARQADGPPRIVVDQSACERCTMLISEPAYAAAYRLDGRDHLFDDLGCLLETLRDEPAGEAPADRARVWVHDLDSRTWLTAEEAVFVRAQELRTPMGGGLVAVADRRTAEALARRTGGRVVTDFQRLLRETDDDD